MLSCSVLQYLLLFLTTNESNDSLFSYLAPLCIPCCFCARTRPISLPFHMWLAWQEAAAAERAPSPGTWRLWAQSGLTATSWATRCTSPAQRPITECSKNLVQVRKHCVEDVWLFEGLGYSQRRVVQLLLMTHLCICNLLLWDFKVIQTLNSHD